MNKIHIPTPAELVQSTQQKPIEQIEDINKKYQENAEGLDEVIKQRRLDNDIKEAKKAYSRLIKGLNNKTYMKLDWLKKDVQSLKNCYLNNYNDLKAIHYFKNRWQKCCFWYCGLISRRGYCYSGFFGI